MNFAESIIGNYHQGRRHVVTIGLPPYPSNLHEAAQQAAAFAVTPNHFISEPESFQEFVQEIRQVAPHALIIARHASTDIGESNLMWVRAHYEQMQLDGAFINALCGIETVLPWVADPLHGAFVTTLHTSTSSLSRFLLTDGTPLHQHIAHRLQEANQRHNVVLAAHVANDDELGALTKYPAQFAIAASAPNCASDDAFQQLRRTRIMPVFRITAIDP